MSKCSSSLQRGKEVEFDSVGILDFAIGLVIFVVNLPDWQVLFFGEILGIVINPTYQKGF